MPYSARDIQKLEDDVSDFPEKTFWIVWSALLVFGICAWVAILWVAIHFIRMYW